jgi:hypothetical protein
MVPRLGDSWTIRSAVQLLCLQQALASWGFRMGLRLPSILQIPESSLQWWSQQPAAKMWLACPRGTLLALHFHTQASVSSYVKLGNDARSVFCQYFSLWKTLCYQNLPCGSR